MALRTTQNRHVDDVSYSEGFATTASMLIKQTLLGGHLLLVDEVRDQRSDVPSPAWSGLVIAPPMLFLKSFLSSRGGYGDEGSHGPVALKGRYRVREEH